jgi:hypothetical protein
VPAPASSTQIGNSDFGPTPVPRGQTLPATSSRLPTRLTVSGLRPRKLVLRVSAGGRITVLMSRRIRHAGKLGWRTFKTLRIKARKAGTITVELPPLRPGSYRLGIALAGSKSVFRTLTVHHR